MSAFAPYMLGAVLIACISQDILSKFNGSWTLTPKHDSDSNSVGTLAVLNQDVLPAGDVHYILILPVLFTALLTQPLPMYSGKASWLSI